jgi:hypothetical protein
MMFSSPLVAGEALPATTGEAAPSGERGAAPVAAAPGGERRSDSRRAWGAPPAGIICRRPPDVARLALVVHPKGNPNVIHPCG